MRIGFSRWLHDDGSWLPDPRDQLNEITSWLDGSMVYGSDGVRAAALRTFSGGRLKTRAGGLMPVNRIDGTRVGNGGPGPVTRRLTDLYWALHEDPAYSTAVAY